MGYRTIAVVVTDEGADMAAVDSALSIAALGQDHVDIACVGIDMTRVDTMPLGTTMMTPDYGLPGAQDRALALKTAIDKAVAGRGIAVAVRPEVVPNMGLEPALSRLTRYADLAVAVRPYGPGRAPMQATAAEAVLFGAGTPLLVVPPQGLATALPFRRVMLAWNESDEALAAARAALPFLQAAQHVDIVLVDPPSHSPERSDPGGSLAVMLSRHGLRPEISILSRTLPRVSDVLLRFAQEHGADLLVLGAYGHSRFREAILGGVTRDMLETAPIPVFMAR